MSFAKTGKNKHTNTLIKKKLRKSPRYRCCQPITGNKNKFSTGYCCTYPMIYKRYDNSLYNKKVALGSSILLYEYS
jgi:hypothetical protein